MVKFIKRVKINDRQKLRNNDANPILNTEHYLVEMYDGYKMEIMANIIAECMYLKLDSEGHPHQIIHEIVEHKKDKTAIGK